MQDRVLKELTEMDHTSVERKYFQMVCQWSVLYFFFLFFFLFLNFIKPFIFFLHKQFLGCKFFFLIQDFKILSNIIYIL